jgi:hypothetical protein
VGANEPRSPVYGTLLRSAWAELTFRTRDQDMASRSTELETLRSRLAGVAPLDPANWPKVEAWVASATPLIRTRFPDHLEDFRSVCATPRWSFSPRFSTGGDSWSGTPARDNFAEAAAHDKTANQRRAEEAKEKILSFLDGLIGLSGVEEAAAASTSTETAMSSTLRIFISHAGADAALAKALIDLIEAGLEVPTGSIRCTSVPGYKLDGGDDAPEVLRENLKVCSVVLGMLTKKSISSSYVVMELGAAWAFKKRAIPLIGPGATFDNLPGPFKDIHALKMDHDTDMSGLLKTIARETGLAETSNMPKVITALQALMAVLGSTTPASEVSTRPPFDPEPVPPPVVMDDDEALVHLERWLDQLAGAVQDGNGTTPMILGAADIATQAHVPEAKASLVSRVAVQNPHFGVTIAQLRSGKFRFDIGARKIKMVRHRRG